MNIDFNFTNLSSRYNLMSQLFGVKKSQSNGLINLTDVLNAKNQKRLGATNKSSKSVEEMLYESGLVVEGMIANGKSLSEMHQMIDVSEEYRQKMFDMVKEEFIRENGVANGDTTRRSEVFREYQLSINKDDRLKGTWSLEQYEKQYWLAIKAAIKAVDPNWKNGQPFDASILNGITRESIDNTLVKSGNTLVRKGVNYSI